MKLLFRILRMMALSAKLTEEKAAKDRAADKEISPTTVDCLPGTSGEGSTAKPAVEEGSNLLVNFPLLPLTKGGCISLQRGLASYKEALLSAGFTEELSVFRSEDMTLPGVDESRI